MPAGDGTGPMGLGPMTGRAAGYCAGYSVPGYMNPIPGRGFWGRGWGRGRGRGRGWRNWYYGTGLTGWQRASMGMPAYGDVGPYVGPPVAPFATEPSQEQETEFLKQQAEYFKNAIDDINKRLEEIQQQTTKD